MFIVLAALCKQPPGPGLERRRAAPSAGVSSPVLHPHFPGATSPSAGPARAPQADPAPPPRPLSNSLSNPFGVEIAVANALRRRENPQQVKEACGG